MARSKEQNKSERIAAKGSRGKSAATGNGSARNTAGKGKSTIGTGKSLSGTQETSAASEELLVLLPEKLAEIGQRDFTRLDLPDLARLTRVPLDVIRSRYKSTDDWIDGWYCDLTDRYRTMVREIPDFSEYTVGEKLLNFYLTSMDMMSEREPFVRSTYHPFILDRFTSTRFEQSVAELFREFTEQDSRVAFSQQLLLFSPVYTWWSREYLHMAGRRLSHPDSGPQMMALAEKTAGLLNEFLYNGVVDSTLDLGKYLLQNGFVSVWTPVTVLRKFLRF